MKRILVVILGLAVLLTSCCLTGATYDPSSVHPATRQDVLAFLLEDKTNEQRYDLLRYNCLNFALDLWHNAYLRGLDAFLMVLNEPCGWSHIRVGFSSIGWAEAEGREYGWTEYWGNKSAPWLYVEPTVDMFMTGENGTTLQDSQTIRYIRGEDVFELWESVKGNRAKLPLISLYVDVLLFKIGKL